MYRVLKANYYLKEVGALGRNMEQENIFLVSVHEVGTVLLVLVIVKMLVTWNIHDLHVWAHKWVVAIVRRQANETVELFQLARIPCILEEDVVQSLLFASEHNWWSFRAHR